MRCLCCRLSAPRVGAPAHKAALQPGASRGPSARIPAIHGGDNQARLDEATVQVHINPILVIAS